MTKRRLVDKPSYWGFLFVLPWLLGFLVFTAGPMLTSLYLSFTKYDLNTIQFVGTKNYHRLFYEEPLCWKSLQFTNTYAIFSVASSLLWIWIFNPDYGLLNYALSLFGIGGAEWLMDEKYTLGAFIVMSLWCAGGGRMIIFLAGLQGISDTYYEAARLDGASHWQQFRFITIPQLSPVIFFNLILGIIGAFQVFTTAYIMTGGGPNNATLFYALSIFRNAFEYFKLGKASAMAWVLFVILLIITAVQFWGSKRWVYYEGEAKS